MDPAIQTYQKASTEHLRDQLILDNVDYVRKILSTITAGLPSHYDKENLEQAGVVALVETANSFEPARGVFLSHLLFFHEFAEQSLDEMRKNSPVPQKMLDDIKQVKSAYETLTPPVTPEQLATETGLGIERILRVLEAMRFSKPQMWNDLYCNIHSGWREGEEQPGVQIETRELKKLLADCIKKVTRKRTVWCW